MTDHVTVDSAQGVMTITLPRNEKKNAITSAMYGTMADAIAGAESNPLHPGCCLSRRRHHVHVRK